MKPQGRVRLRDERGLVGKSIVILLLFLAVLAVAGLDTFAILRARYSVSDTADAAATDAAFRFRDSRDVDESCALAIETVSRADKTARIPRRGCVVDGETGDVTITVRKEASTIVAKRLGFLEEYTRAEATSTAPAPP